MPSTAAIADGIRCWPVKDYTAMALEADSEKTAFRLASSAASGLAPQPLALAIPNRHLEYAITWYRLFNRRAGMA